jgi:N-acyl-D-amino-acid deacylase
MLASATTTMRLYHFLPALALLLICSCADEPDYDLVVRGGTIYDGSGRPGFVGDVAVRGDRIAYVGPRAPGDGLREIDASGRAVAPGFSNMLSWSNESLLIDGRGQGELRQGVTLEVMGEGWSMGPLTPGMKEELIAQQGDLKYPVEWTTLGEYLEVLEKKGVSVNVASHIGAATARMNLLGEADVDPTPEQLNGMRVVVQAAMEEGALGVASSLIYAPGTFAETDELVALAETAGRCGGIYATHMRGEGRRLLEAIDETIEISRRSGTPAEIYHLKAAGRENWPKLEQAIARIEAARHEGLRITTEMYSYPAAGTGLDAAMPPWVQAGGNDAWFARLRDPAIRRRVAAEMRAPDAGWENIMQMSGGPEQVLLAVLRNPALKPLIGKTLAEVAKERGVTAEEAAMDLVIEDESRVGAIYFLMSEGNVRRQVALPYMSFGSDGTAVSAEGVFLKSNLHPRGYGNFARVFARYVRDEKVLTIEEAVRRMTAQPAAVLGLRERGQLKSDYYADVVVFDPATIQDHATYAAPHQYSTGVSHVLVNGVEVLRDGEPTAARPGRVVRGRGWTGWNDGGCRASPAEWEWPFWGPADWSGTANAPGKELDSN